MNKIFYISILAAFAVTSCSPSAEKKEKKESQNDTSKKMSFHVDSIGEQTLNGEYVKKYINGIIQIKGDYRNGQRNGLWQSWYPSGTLWSETTFKAGVKEGTTITYYENGMVRYRGFYKNDERAGKWKMFDESGKFQKEIDYSKEQK